MKLRGNIAVRLHELLLVREPIGSESKANIICAEVEFHRVVQRLRDWDIVRLRDWRMKDWKTEVLKDEKVEEWEIHGLQDNRIHSSHWTSYGSSNAYRNNNKGNHTDNINSKW